MAGTLVLVIIVVIFVSIILLRHIKIVPKSKRLVIFRLGKFHSVNTGLALLAPFVDKGELMDVERQAVELKIQKVSILDSDPVNLTVNVGYQVVDPSKAILNVADYKSAILTLLETQIRKISAAVTLTDLLTERPKLQENIREAVNLASQEWGVTVEDLVISFVDVSDEIQHELRRKAEAERLRRIMNEK